MADFGGRLQGVRIAAGSHNGILRRTSNQELVRERWQRRQKLRGMFEL